MSNYRKFRKKDIFFNVLETYPEKNFLIYQSKVYHRTKKGLDQTPSGHLDLYEMNLNRTGEEADNDLVYPFIVKDTTRSHFRTMTTSEYDAFNFGDQIKGKYPMTASLVRSVIPAGPAFSTFTFDHQRGLADPPAEAHANKKYVTSLENIMGEYEILSRHFTYEYDDNAGMSWNKGTQAANLISIPSIMYGTTIKKGSVKLGYYYGGSLVAELTDRDGNGELIQTTGEDNLGKVGGVVLYNHGFVFLTGSWVLDDQVGNFVDGSPSTPTWLLFGAGMPTMGNTAAPGLIPSASFGVSFKGVNSIPTLTMMARARKNELNYSSNPTAIDFTKQQSRSLLKKQYSSTGGQVKNLVKSPFKGYEEKFDNETYISKIGIYDERHNLLGYATLATPVRKTHDRDLTFKLKIDI
jgi:hypothetical protein